MSSGTPPLILASASPRRAALLQQLGVAHVVRAADIDEQRLPGEPVQACVLRLARAKAAVVRDALPPAQRATACVLGADTAVVLDDEMLGKPHTREPALAMLRRLSGREHRVLTGIALWSTAGCDVAMSESAVRFRALDDDECARYWQSGEPCDKAGAYAIQGRAAAFIAELRGSYSGVMGLPLFETAELLRRAGVPVWQEVSE
jgi:septum formation protein